MLVLRTYGLCGLSVDQRTAEKERVSGSKVMPLGRNANMHDNRVGQCPEEDPK
jgi:hypothetical protein